MSINHAAGGVGAGCEAAGGGGDGLGQFAQGIAGNALLANGGQLAGVFELDAPLHQLVDHVKTFEHCRGGALRLGRV